MLRDYQNAAVESVLRALTTSGSAVLQMPTGAGKTKAATEIIKRHDKPVWFICHRQEIEQQAARAFAAAGIDFGIVSPRARPDYGKPVQIVSVATLARRIADMPLPLLAIWDECHHVAAKSWARIREQLADSQNLGLTATPERLDGKGLSEWFAELIVGPSTRELINDGWLSDFRYFAPSEPDLAGARLRAGDYAKKDLAKVMNTPVLIGDAIAEYRKNAAGKRALVFCASVEASKELVERFNADGIPARHVDGDTPTSERDAAVEALASGEIKVLSNVEVFTEGFDLPAIDAVILLRPTKSLALFLQMIGRVLRKTEGKDEALIFDHAGLWLDHGWLDLPIEWSLDGGARKRRLAAMKRGPRRCPECHEVRVEREPVCTCGYEFPTGREIGEYDGVLYELRGEVPEGCVTVAEFARMMNVGLGQTVPRWIDRGMPTVGRQVPIREATEWVEKNAPRLPDGCLSLKSFAKKHGVSSGTPGRWAKRGMPIENGYVRESVGDAWVSANVRKCPDGWEPVSKFAKRHGVTIAAVTNGWSGRGLTCENGFVPIKLGDEWVSENVSLETIKQRQHQISKAPPGLEKQRDIARRYGVTPSSVNRWVKLGLPTRDGFVITSLADDWISKNINLDTSRVRSIRSKNHPGYLPLKVFARNIGKENSGQSWVARGMPIEERGIHIQRGLEWVRDNTNIEIPPEAWPSANDNSPASQSDAA